MIENRVRDSDDPAQVFASAQLLEGLSLSAESNDALLRAAEKLYRQVAEEDSSKRFALAEFLGRHQQIDAGIDICLKNESSKEKTALLITAIAIINQKHATKEQRRRVEASVKAAIKSDSSTRLLIALGTLYEADERFDEAIEVYEQAQKANPSDVISLNNSALLYGWRGDKKRANELIEEAIKRVGPIAALLDTRGTIRLSQGKIDEALKDFSAATADSPSAVRLYHLAQAQLQAGKSAVAKQTYAEAVKAGLKPTDLHPLEVAVYDSLHRQLTQ